MISTRDLQAQRAGDLDQLLLADRQPVNDGPRAGGKAQTTRDRLGLGINAAIEDPQRSAARRLASEENVAGDVQALGQVQFLMDERDAGLLRVMHAIEAEWTAVETDLASVGRVDPAQDLHQS